MIFFRIFFFKKKKMLGIYELGVALERHHKYILVKNVLSSIEVLVSTSGSLKIASKVGLCFVSPRI